MMGAIGRTMLGAGIGGFAGAVGAKRDPNGQNYNAIRGAAQGAAYGALGGMVLGGTLRRKSTSYAAGFRKGASLSSNDIVSGIKNGLSEPGNIAASGAQFAEKVQAGGLEGAASMAMRGLGYMAGVAPMAAATPFVAGFRGLNAMQAKRAGGPVPYSQTAGAIGGVGTKVAGFGMLGAGLIMPMDGPQVRGVKNRRADMASMRNQQQMAMADAVIMRNPNMAGMRDVDSAYDYMPANRSSAMPLSGRQAENHQRMMRRSQRRMRPGMYGDGGDLVFAMNDLRRSY